MDKCKKITFVLGSVGQGGVEIVKSALLKDYAEKSGLTLNTKKN